LAKLLRTSVGMRYFSESDEGLGGLGGAGSGGEGCAAAGSCWLRVLLLGCGAGEPSGAMATGGTFMLLRGGVSGAGEALPWSSEWAACSSGGATGGNVTWSDGLAHGTDIWSG
jgi:hypothetical protein